MAAAYAWADMAACRSGALTLAELSAAGLGALLVPFAAAVDDHQTRNARFLVEQGAAVLLPQSGCHADGVGGDVTGLLQDRSRPLAMAKSARALARGDAAELVADVCLSAGGLA